MAKGINVTTMSGVLTLCQIDKKTDLLFTIVYSLILFNFVGFKIYCTMHFNDVGKSFSFL